MFIVTVPAAPMSMARLAAETIGEQPVDDLAAGVSEQRRRDDGADIRLAETELLQIAPFAIEKL